MIIAYTLSVLRYLLLPFSCPIQFLLQGTFTALLTCTVPLYFIVDIGFALVCRFISKVYYWHLKPSDHIAGCVYKGSSQRVFQLRACARRMIYLSVFLDCHLPVELLRLCLHCPRLVGLLPFGIHLVLKCSCIQ